MTRSRYTENQIIGFIKEAEGGVPVAELCRQHGCGRSTFHKWQATSYGDLCSGGNSCGTAEQLDTAGLCQ